MPTTLQPEVADPAASMPAIPGLAAPDRPAPGHPTPSRQAQLDALLHDTAIAPLDDTGWIRVTGEDRVRWLNGMVTNSIVALAPGQGCYNFVLNAQGRIQADLTAFAEPNALALKTSRTRLPALIALLDRFIIMDDVELADVSADCTGFAIAGPHAAALLESIGLPANQLAPMHKQAAPWQDSFAVLLHEHSPLVPRFEVWTQPAHAAAIRAALISSGATPCDAQALEDLRILEGTPLYGTDIRNTETARDLPQETTPIGVPHRALHFSKGCYLGQEIVERIHSRGNVHRTFSGFRLTGTLPTPGTALESDGKPVGELTSVATVSFPAATISLPAASIPLPAPIHLALGYLRREALDRGLALTYPGGSASPIALPQPLSKLQA